MSEVSATVVVLAGGEATRFGSDKLAAPFAGSSVLDRTVAGMPPGWPVVVVGPERPLARPVTWAREDPPGGGPLAGVAAALPEVGTELLVVVAGDLPAAGRVTPDLVGALAAEDPAVGAVAAVDGEGHANPLLTAYRSRAVREAMPADPADRAARTLLRRIPHVGRRVDPVATLDIDTPAALAEMARRLEP